MTAIESCLRCDQLNSPCNGACACRMDRKDISAHWSENYCPHPSGAKFGDGTKPGKWEDVPDANATPLVLAEHGPGEFVKAFLEAIGIGRTNDGVVCPNGKIISACGCEAMRVQMNEWGWRGCLGEHRAEIVTWFRGKAGECGITFSVLGLLRMLVKAHHAPR